MLFKHPHKLDAKTAIEELVSISSYLIDLFYLAETGTKSFQSHETLVKMGKP